jgi:hypothetical protein
MLNRSSLASRQRYDFVGAHADVCGSPVGFDSPAAFHAYSDGSRSFADKDVVTCHLEFNLCTRQEAELVANLLRDGHLSFGVDSHA